MESEADEDDVEVGVVSFAGDEVDVECTDEACDVADELLEFCVDEELF